MAVHTPVLQKEVLEYLDPKPNENFIDCTTGEGGHTNLILEKNKPNGKVLGIEIDSDIYQRLKLQTNERLILVNDSYINLKDIVEKYKFKPVYGILFDLGMSSWHLEESKKGFSFLRDEPLDMRYDLKSYLTAQEIVNQWPETKIVKILKEYGEERFARRIAKEIVNVRRAKSIRTTLQLVEIIKRATPGFYQRKRIHFATKTFQALRIAVNDELENIKKGLEQSSAILEPSGRLVVISFHSLEDRIVKNFFREKYKNNFLKILTKKPIKPSELEMGTNPRSRSAKLRAIMKV